MSLTTNKGNKTLRTPAQKTNWRNLH